jgi:hypothetical protein
VCWLGRKILGIDESLAESPWRWLRTVPSAPYRLVGTFALPTAIAIAIPWVISTAFSGPFGRARWWRRLTRCVPGIDRGRAPAIVTATSSAAAMLAIASAVSRRRLRIKLLAEMAIKILGLHIRDVEKPVASDGEIDEGGLNRRLEVDNFALIDVTRVTLVAGSFDVELLEGAILDDGDTAFLGLEHIDEHFFLHAGSFRDFRRQQRVGRRSLRFVSLSGPFWNGRARYRSLCSVRPVARTQPKSPGEFDSSLGLGSRASRVESF